jgi:hypothetical protein
MFRVKKDFNGSPTGAVTNSYKLGETLPESAFGSSLLSVALENEWVEPVPQDNAAIAIDDHNDFQSLHWRQLKKMVEELGGEYIDKPSAIGFLSDA